MNLALDTATETWEDVHRLVYSLAWRFIIRYHTPVDETLATANLGYIKAFRSYDSTRSSITTWVQIKVWRELLSQLRRTIEQSQRFKLESMNESLDNLPKTGRFNVEAFAAELSADAAFIVRTVITTKGYQPRTLRKVLIQHLLDLGWAMKRIVSSMAEIGDALK